MYGTLAGALEGRKIPFEQTAFTAQAEGRIVRAGKVKRIASIAIHYELTVPPAFREATIRALRVHPRACPAHLSVQGAITVTWDAVLHVGDEDLKLGE